MDVTGHAYMQDSARFADFMNAANFDGQQIIEPWQLCEADSRTTRVTQLDEAASQATGHTAQTDKKDYSFETRYRDVIKKTALGTNFVLMGVENQSHTHYAMPVRCLNYDTMNYNEQLRVIQKQHEKLKDLRQDEFLSKFSRDDQLIPVITWVINWGSEVWDGALDLHGLLNFTDIPEALKDKINNYKMNILNVRDFEHLEYFKTDLQQVFGFIQKSGDKKQLAEYVKEHEEVFSNLPEDAYNVISAVTYTGKLVELKKDIANEGGNLNVCKAIEDMINDGKIEYKISLIRKKYAKHLTPIEAADALEITEDEVTKFYKLIDLHPDFTDSQIAELFIQGCDQ